MITIKELEKIITKDQLKDMRNYGTYEVSSMLNDISMETGGALSFNDDGNTLIISSTTKINGKIVDIDIDRLNTNSLPITLEGLKKFFDKYTDEANKYDIREIYKYNLKEFSEYHDNNRPEILEDIADFVPEGDRENTAWEAGYLKALDNLMN